MVSSCFVDELIYVMGIKSMKKAGNHFFKSIENYIFAKFFEGKRLVIKKTLMTKAEIVNKISAKTGIDKTTVLMAVEAFMDTVKESLSNEENVYLRGFGSFILKKRAQKVARNISKNTTIVIPEHNIPAFKPAKTFMQEIIKE